MNNLLGKHPERALYLEKAEELRACLLEWLTERKSVHHYSVSQRDLLNGGRPTGNDATFISQEVPELVPGDTVAVSITMKNSGTSTWTREGQFKLGSQAPADNNFWGPERLELAAGESVVPGEEATFTFEVIVPDAEGIFHFQWQMVQEGEEWFGAKSDLKQLLSGNPGSYLDDCDQLSQWNSSSGLKLNQTEHTQGTACIEFSAAGTDEFKKVFSPPFNCRGTVADTELRFWYYVSDVTQFDSGNQVEIGSSGRPDRDEFSWQLSGLTDGWNLYHFKDKRGQQNGLSRLTCHRLVPHLPPQKRNHNHQAGCRTADRPEHWPLVYLARGRRERGWQFPVGGKYIHFGTPSARWNDLRSLAHSIGQSGHRR
jgi:hypothetical protein